MHAGSGWRRKVLATLLAVLLWADAGFAKHPREPGDRAAEIRAIRTRLAALHPGTPVELRLLSGEKVRGRLVSDDPAGLTLRQNTSARYIRMDDVKSLKPVPSKGGRVVIWICAGALIGVVVVALAILLKERSNE